MVTVSRETVVLSQTGITSVTAVIVWRQTEDMGLAVFLNQILMNSDSVVMSQTHTGEISHTGLKTHTGVISHTEVVGLKKVVALGL